MGKKSSTSRISPSPILIVIVSKKAFAGKGDKTIIVERYIIFMNMSIPIMYGAHYNNVVCFNTLTGPLL